MNRKQARDFAKAMGTLAKTDRVDTQGLASLGGVLLAGEDLERYLKPQESAEQQDVARWSRDAASWWPCAAWNVSGCRTAGRSPRAALSS